MEKVATRGRPREFDTDEALGHALRLFWQKGYEGTSLSDLTEAMGITRPSLYAAFGNKENLFSLALDLYEKDKLAYIGEAVEAPTAPSRPLKRTGSGEVEFEIVDNNKKYTIKLKKKRFVDKNILNSIKNQGISASIF